MEFTVYQVDAFSHRPFSGNPAAVIVLDHWLEEELMQSIAAEMNLSETAFVVKEAAEYGIRWFTPSTEVELCGHATLASAHVLYQHYGYADNEIRFQSLSGLLLTRKKGSKLQLDFPKADVKAVEIPTELIDAISARPIAVASAGQKLLVEFDSARRVCELKPDMNRLLKVPYTGICCCALANDYVADPQPDFISRFFAPKAGINEDPVTGSAHTLLMPYFANKTGKSKLLARQASARGGDLELELQGDRVLIAGDAVTVMKGSLSL
ncbi:PhzF family phenazine biosynthesis protein [Alteromonadaceae bacterium 2753L.S.0a.02]|nr:PhzF family phenazine biosynthesis protein [Alteromonadaceae bacterium 2753L.S.0a.02]